VLCDGQQLTACRIAAVEQLVLLLTWCVDIGAGKHEKQGCLGKLQQLGFFVCAAVAEQAAYSVVHAHTISQGKHAAALNLTSPSAAAAAAASPQEPYIELMQNKSPKVDAASLAPASFPADADLEW
jgi:hypothetical protein